MDFYKRVSAPSEMHLVKKNRDGIELYAVDNSRDAIERFQAVAKEVFEHEGDGYKIILEHINDRHPGALYDRLVLQLTD